MHQFLQLKQLEHLKYRQPTWIIVQSIIDPLLSSMESKMINEKECVHVTNRNLAAIRVRTNCVVGTKTLPPKWPHFFSLDNWSSKCIPAAPASMNAYPKKERMSQKYSTGRNVVQSNRTLVSSKAWRGPPNPASASATMGTYQSLFVVPFSALKRKRRRIKHFVFWL